MSQNALVVGMVAVAGVSEGITPGLKSAWARTADDPAGEAALARAVAAYPLPNDRLLAYAARNPPPQSWYDQDEDLF
jgi:hypothetical protein